MSIDLFVYGSLMSGGTNRINVIKRRPHLFEGGRLYKHVEEDFPTMHITYNPTDIVEGEIITVEDSVFEEIYQMESSSGYTCLRRIEDGMDLIYFSKQLYIHKHLKAGYTYVGSSFKSYCENNPD